LSLFEHTSLYERRLPPPETLTEVNIQLLPAAPADDSFRSFDIDNIKAYISSLI